jgi:hypothetical protein
LPTTPPFRQSPRPAQLLLTLLQIRVATVRASFPPAACAARGTLQLIPRTKREPRSVCDWSWRHTQLFSQKAAWQFCQLLPTTGHALGLAGYQAIWSWGNIGSTLVFQITFQQPTSAPLHLTEVAKQDIVVAPSFVQTPGTAVYALTNAACLPAFTQTWGAVFLLGLPVCSNRNLSI